MKPEVSCCDPKLAYFPSGMRWAHALNCPEQPGQKVRSKAETRARRDHPAGSSKGGSGW